MNCKNGNCDGHLVNRAIDGKTARMVCTKCGYSEVVETVGAPGRRLLTDDVGAPAPGQYLIEG